MGELSPNPADTRDAEEPRGLRMLLIGLILCASLWAFREVVGFGTLPLADDDTNIFFNPHLVAPDGPSLRWMFTNLDYVHRYMPLGWLGFSMAYSLSGLEPWGYHLLNLCTHLLEAWLLFSALCRIVARFSPLAPGRHRLYAAAAATLVWALHPLRVETVAWCSGLLYSEAGIFALLALHARMSELEARERHATPWGWTLLGTAAYGLSVFTYPVALFLPLGLLCLDLAWSRQRTKGLFAAPVAWLALSALSVALNVAARFTVSDYLKPSSLGDFGPLERGLQAAYAVALLVGRTVWPPSVLTMSGGTVFDLDPHDGVWWGCAAVVAVVSFAAWRQRSKRPYLLAAWAAFLVLLAPSLGFMEHPYTAADRYAYLPAWALSAALALALLRPDGRLRVAPCAALFLFSGACAVLCVRQAPVWKDSESFFGRMGRENTSAEVREITVSRMALLRFFRGEVRTARDIARAQLARYPALGGVVLTWQQMEPKAEMTPERAGQQLQEWPAAPWSVIHLAVALSQAKAGWTEDALRHLDASLELSPGYWDARYDRCLFLAELGRPAAVHDWLILKSKAPRTEGARLSFLATKVEPLVRGAKTAGPVPGT
jgi:protein O-mannosyl-transferase